MHKPDCTLCQTPGGRVLWQNAQLRVIDAGDSMYPGLTRVIWTKHVAEMTDLSTAEQTELLRAVLLIERVQRSELEPDKVNLAALGNVVPHLHWHIIPRWHDDPHFPQAVWAALPETNAAQRKVHEVRRASILSRLTAYHRALEAQLAATSSDA